VGSHRALEDIRESVAELNYYRESFFKLADDRARGGVVAT
jgi:oligoribonuclease (3'-5' exoribonuclease)